ncbi:hypothetical protein AaE_015793 [Aphanomyces astaci]|uniref:Uncharacterized protein n=1 Tax=Aphanomyces astaci TaxID=112090 RepID=A0A6A4Z1E7_APHAT|nr:hypothetical protein AaE_015793 [Aphanomyces astaci]
MSRSVSAASIMLNHIVWEGDCLVIRFGRLKNDQEGKHCAPRHVYANPLQPYVCPILSLAILVFTRGVRQENGPVLLFGHNAKERFAKWLSATCSASKDTILSMGLNITEIGTHSLRKGVATALTNTPGGPQAVSVWLRAGWSLGGVQGRYIFAGSGGDQFVGRASAGLNVNDASFATLPPHFHGPVLSVEQWKCIVPGYDSHYPPTFRTTMPFLLASLVHHRVWLKQHLSPSHPLLFSLVWSSGLLVDLADEVLLGVMCNPVSKMMATGIPPHVAQSDKIQTLENEVKMLGSTIQQKLDEMPAIVAGELMAQGGMSGSSQLTTGAFHQGLSQLRESILRDLQQPRLSVDPMVPAESSTTTDASSTPEFSRGFPTQFRFPKCKLSELRMVWWRGVPSDHIPPLRFVKSRDLSNSSDVSNFSKAKRIINALVKHSDKTEYIISQLDPNDSSAEFLACYKKFAVSVGIPTSNDEWEARRMDEMSYLTLYRSFSTSSVPP